MGLDITAHGAIRLDTREYANEDAQLDTLILQRQGVVIGQHLLDWVRKEFPGRADDVKAGMYRTCGSRLDFRAGSYSGYGKWRDWLARVAGWESAEDCWDAAKTDKHFLTRPFALLVNFADNEGIIGPAAAKTLADNFGRHRRDALATECIDRAWNMSRYDLWHAAFRIAADEAGIVELH